MPGVPASALREIQAQARCWEKLTTARREGDTAPPMLCPWRCPWCVRWVEGHMPHAECGMHAPATRPAAPRLTGFVAFPSRDRAGTAQGVGPMCESSDVLHPGHAPGCRHKSAWLQETQ